ncbi:MULTISPECIES: DHA2 family efflux MFS transporter permease subunit [unclassified Lactobacillus]|uniref:DHA2 family efflux MFS transporter permease subunit n=1 Tax=unclassified Lactobacillus TaxID=2620435 RepID=UPI000EFAB157|nr:MULTISPECIES: DHA2 family efflux MFS transporter permease subunit [unclassified Lactobacillus]RMC23718.1 DHA2 family efflux MFS transporter permease subunit [Lactobacillus sp. ESL0247]RMC27478.1 DHA2 family efflux MFS transporter permease subunit [Lactobacillus sp. ESL0246]RMC30679.1 DHA2 family efflux MFS transporter permease subunit [Lactobacillus sp. ESL0245]
MKQEIKNISNQQRTTMMAVLLFGAFVALLAETFLNNALPSIIKSFNISQATAQWLTTAYLLVVGLMIPMSAWVFESFNLRQNFIAMIGIFFTGSIICIFASNFYVLLLGRIIEAIAAGGLMPFIQNVILIMFPPEKRGLAMGITGLVIGFGPAVGPTISGLILKYADWQMLFIILSITSGLVGILAFFLIQNFTVLHKGSIDIISLLESTFGFGLILYTLSEIGNTGKISLLLIITFILGLIIIVLFCLRQLNMKEPLLDIRVFKNIGFDLCTMLSTISNISMVGVELVLPLYLQTTRAETALTAGLVMMPGALIMIICNPISGIMYDKVGIKKLSLFGFAMLLLGTLPMVIFNAYSSLILISACYALRMVGISFTMMTTFTAGINMVEDNLTAHANASSSTIRQIGGSLGTALAMLVVTVSATSSKGNKLVKLTSGYRFGFLLMLGFALIGLVCSFMLPGIKKDEE